MSCASQVAYDIAWQQQIDKEFFAAEANRQRLTESNGFGLTRASKPAKLAQHWITGFIPITPKAEEDQAQSSIDHSFYEQGMPFRSVYTRRNNPQAILRLRELKNLSSISSPFNNRYHPPANPEDAAPKSAI